MKFATALFSVIVFFSTSIGYAQVVPPKPGVDLPQAYFDRVSSDKTAFQFQNAWIRKTQQIKQNRVQFLARSPGRSMDLSALPDHVRQQISVTGTMRVPVFLARYANTGAAPYPASDLQQQLFDGPWPTGTLTQLYSEMSGGDFNLTGTVYDWVTLSQDDTYYEGGCAGLCGTAKTGQFLLEVLTAADPSVDFGLYDNDGPDGVPNSGDDDGYVDFVAFVHPETGGECFSGNMWSHRWTVQTWPEFSGPYETDDSRAGGGVIRITDYVMQPALSCSGSMIEIGVFAHEFGHAFGLPDLYDRDGGGRGIGVHGLMGSGNWNTPSNPAHMSAWSKVEMGWVLPTEVGPVAQPYTISCVNQTGEVYQLSIMEEKFRRSNIAPIDGSYSLRCGLTGAEAGNRNWPGGAGYGNDWVETIRRDFTYDGTNPVTLQYDIDYDVERLYDYVRMRIKVNGTVRSLRSYTGTGSRNDETIDITSYLNGSGATTYQIIAQFNSDNTISDEDGDINTVSPLALDNISVTGGGENYFTDFEQAEDGWYYENLSKEFFLVENRRRDGQFDQGLLAEGLFIWHIEQNVAGSRYGNTGGTSGTTNLLPAGVMLEEVDGLRELLIGASQGDDGDVAPGSTNNRTFDNATNPSSISHNGLTTNVRITNVSDPAPLMTATMRAGYFPPTVGSITPDSGGSNQVIAISDVGGSGFVHGATFLLRDAGMTEYQASTSAWTGKTKLSGTLDLSGVPEGTYDVVVRNPDGQEAVLGGGFTVDATVPTAIQGIYASVRGATVELTWKIWSDETIQGFRILRREASAAVEEPINPVLIAPGERSFVDEDTRPGGSYEYVLVVVFADGSELRSLRVTAKIAAYALELYQNHPNPFNPSTRIRFSLPGQTHVQLAVYDAAGKRVATLLDEVGDAGLNEVIWDGRSDSGAMAASGVYFYRLSTQKKVLTKKMLLLK
jgi:M6 family metalloprotease-like protein